MTIKFRKLGWLVSMWLAACGSALAVTIQDAWVYYDQSNFNKAAEVLRSLSPIPSQGLGALCAMAVTKKAISNAPQDLRYCQDAVTANDPHGQVAFGGAYLLGNEWLGVQKNETLGLGYLASAVTANYPVASEVLCANYYRAAQFARAAPFCKVAAASGLPGGLLQLALMSMEGKGAVQDFEKGRKFALLSASLNYAEAYVLLGNIANSDNKGQSKNLVSAYAWYALAAAAAPDWDQPQKARDGLGLDQAKVAEAQKMAGSWKKTPAQKWRDLYPVAGAAAGTK